MRPHTHALLPCVQGERFSLGGGAQVAAPHLAEGQLEAPGDKAGLRLQAQYGLEEFEGFAPVDLRQVPAYAQPGQEFFTEELLQHLFEHPRRVLQVVPHGPAHLRAPAVELGQGLVTDAPNLHRLHALQRRLWGLYSQQVLEVEGKRAARAYRSNWLALYSRRGLNSSARRRIVPVATRPPQQASTPS